MQRNQQRAEIKQRLTEGFHAWELVLLEIPRSVRSGHDGSFRRVHDREFEYHNQLYDVVEEQSVGDVTWYLVYPDNKETKLKAQMKRLIRERQQQGDKPLLEQLIKVTASWLSVDLPFFKFNVFVRLNDNAYTKYLFALKEFRFTSIEHPPCSE